MSSPPLRKVRDPMLPAPSSPAERLPGLGDDELRPPESTRTYATEVLALHLHTLAGETPILVATDTNWVVNGGPGVPGVVPLLTYFLGHGGDPAAPDASGCTA